MKYLSTIFPHQMLLYLSITQPSPSRLTLNYITFLLQNGQQRVLDEIERRFAIETENGIERNKTGRLQRGLLQRGLEAATIFTYSNQLDILPPSYFELVSMNAVSVAQCTGGISPLPYPELPVLRELDGAPPVQEPPPAYEKVVMINSSASSCD